MARKDDLKAAAEGWLEPAAAAEPTAPAVSLYRRAGQPDTLIAMAEDGRAWQVPDQAGGWAARAELGKAPAARGLTRLGSADERKARARLGVTVEDLGQPDQVTPAAEPTPKRSTSGKAQTSSSGKGKAAVDPGDAGTLDSQVVCYVTAAERAALTARAAADDRSVSYVTRAALRRYLGLE